MKQLGSHLLRFALFFCLVVVGLLLIDFWIFDRISNPYLVQAKNTGHTEKNIIIGSSQVKWSLIDSLTAETTVLAEGGQFTYGSVAVLITLAERDLLRGRRIFIDLHESDEIASGFGQWWYFSEAFVEYRYASLLDFPVNSWPSITARIIKDLAHFSPNSQSTFAWKPLEKAKGHENVHANKDSVNLYQSNFRNCAVGFSIPYASALVRINAMFDKIEKDEDCKIYVLLVPYPQNGCIKDYEKVFGHARVVDLTGEAYGLDDFHDNTHLNSKGALKFTAGFNHRLRELDGEQSRN